MSVFKLPKGVCKTITDEIAGCWWGDGEEKKKMHWFAWWKMCVPKKKGGLGFRDLHSFNLALLAKQCWRLIQNPDSLCARVLSAKYYPEGNILKAGPKKSSSFTWQSIVAGIQTFKRGCIWRVGTHRRANRYMAGSMDPIEPLKESDYTPRNDHAKIHGGTDKST